MKAAVIEKQGGIENIVYRDFPDPKIGRGDLLIRVKALRRANGHSLHLAA
jgi:alcohol dehydrogenase